MVTGSDSASCGFPLTLAPAMRKYLVEQILRRRLRPVLQNAIAQGGIAAADQCRRAVLHHGDEFRGRLPRVERNYDQAFRHDGQIERDPVDAVVRQQGAAVAFLQTLGQQERTGLRYAFQQSVPAETVA